MISQRNIVSYPSQELRDAVANSRIIESTKGFRLAKITGSRKIDLIVALSFAVVIALKERRPEPGMIGYYRQLCEQRPAQPDQPIPPAELLRMEEGGEEANELIEIYERGMAESEQRTTWDWRTAIRSVGDPSYVPPAFERRK